jgi:ribosome hibernation promoting factor
MDESIRARNFKLEPGVEEHIRKRLRKFERHLDDLDSAEVLLSQQPTRSNAQRIQYVAQFTLHTRHDIIRAEVANDELLTAVDQGLDHLGRQIERRKTRQDRRKKGSSIGKSPAVMNVSTSAPSVVEMAAPAEAPEESASGNDYISPEDDEESGQIVRVKRFTVKPLHPEEAVEQMELLGHNFFVFYNAEDERLSVVYRRNDGNYGLIEPEFS